MGTGMLREITFCLAGSACAVSAEQRSTQVETDVKLEQLKKDFPLTLAVSRSEVTDHTKDSPGGVDMGMGMFTFVVVRATLDGAAHWWISCSRENPLAEAILCAPLAPGRYPARWVHNGELLQVLVEGDNGELQGRFYDVEPYPHDPPGPNDSAVR